MVAGISGGVAWTGVAGAVGIIVGAARVFI